MKRRKALVGMESLESLTLLSGFASSGIPRSMLGSIESPSREIRGLTSLPNPDSGVSAIAFDAGNAHPLRSSQLNRSTAVERNVSALQLGGRSASAAASELGPTHARALEARPWLLASSARWRSALQASETSTPVDAMRLSKTDGSVFAGKAGGVVDRFARGQGHGFIGGAAGAKSLQRYAPARLTSSHQLNQPLGQARANRIARALGLVKSQCFTHAQFLAFISGQGKNGSGDLQSAQLVDESVAILTNSNANPAIRSINGQPTQIVLGSYGLTVNTAGMLESPANADAPTRQVNTVIAPGGYLSTWSAANGAEASLQMLYRSAYTRQLPYGFAAQHQGGVTELALYRNGRKSAVTGLSMVPSIWEINFALIYVLDPGLAARMPAYWSPIPAQVVAALEQSATGQVPFSEYSSYLHYNT